MKQTILELQNVSLQIPGNDIDILTDIHYQVHAGDFIVILGSNGSGKSSLLKLLDQRYHPTSGNILLNHKILSDYSRKEISHKIKTLTQNCHESLFTSLTIIENYLLVKEHYEPNLFSMKNKTEREFLKNYLLKFNKNLPNKLDQVVEHLSGGEKQALALALTVLYPPELLLLDEHTSALDPHSSENIMQLTQSIAEEFKITCLLTTHDLSVAESFGNRILALKQGKAHQVIESDAKSQTTRKALLTACY